MIKVREGSAPDFEDLQKQRYISSLGIDALSPDLTAQIIFEKISKSEVPIKQILLNQYIFPWWVYCWY